jgi:hypothetical protein
MMLWLIQNIIEAMDDEEAWQILADERAQPRCVGGRVMRMTCDSGCCDMYRVQSFYESNGQFPDGWLPEGLKHVAIPSPEFARTFGIVPKVFERALN